LLGLLPLPASFEPMIFGWLERSLSRIKKSMGTNGSIRAGSDPFDHTRIIESQHRCQDAAVRCRPCLYRFCLLTQISGVYTARTVVCTTIGRFSECGDHDAKVPYACQNAVVLRSTHRYCARVVSEAATKPGQRCPNPHAKGEWPGTTNPSRRRTGTRCEARREE
jgi:hypothetical protein